LLAAALLLSLNARASGSTPMALTYTVTTTADSGAGSLRQAILDSNASVGVLDTIDFSIAGGGVHTIAPLDNLPVIDDPVIIDGTSQPGYAGTPLIELDGVNSPSGGFSAGYSPTTGFGAKCGLYVLAGNCTIRGLAINGFQDMGILLVNGGANLVEGNYLGTNAAGTAADGNDKGILILDSPNNTIGGITAAARNVISGNLTHGVHVMGLNATGNIVRGNYVGLNAAGTAAVGNGNTGLLIESAFPVVGGTAAGAGNVVSGNFNGIYLDVLGPIPPGFSSGAPGNCTIQGNLVGTDAAGTANLGNLLDGIFVEGDTGTIGGSSAAARNVVAGGTRGLYLAGDNLTAQGNFIGTNAAGTVAIANFIGVLVGGQDNVLGGPGAGEGNLISGNNVAAIGSAGVMLISGASGFSIAGNRIGTNLAGTAALPNRAGVRVEDGCLGGTLGGATIAHANVISGNVQSGLIVSGAVTVTGNRIGTNLAGAAALPNGQHGISIEGFAGAFISSNVISGNVGSGVRVQGGASSLTLNRIGTDLAGTGALPNGDGGVKGNATGLTMTSNTIAFNVSHGVEIPAGDANRMTQNSIHSNGGRGIELGAAGAEPDDFLDIDAGANGVQNLPVLLSALTVGPDTVITGVLRSAPNQEYVIELFSNVAADASGYGEGQTYLGNVTDTTDVNGVLSFSLTVGGGLAAGLEISATASNSLSNDTSEFSQNLAVGEELVAPSVEITGPTTETLTSSASATFALSGTASDNVAVTGVTWTNSLGGAGAATGVGPWTASIPLVAGFNVITVTATDAQGNTATDSITVAHRVGGSAVTVKETEKLCGLLGLELLVLAPLMRRRGRRRR
jgi:hypothetical protein